jgi:hypothetical protein
MTRSWARFVNENESLPMSTPGVANHAFSEAMAISQDATNCKPAAVATP